MGGKKEESSPMREQRRPLSIIVESDSSDDEKNEPNKEKGRSLLNIPTITVTESEQLQKKSSSNNNNNHHYKEEEEDALNDSDLQLLKQVTARLNLSTRRQSYTVWKSENIDRSPRLARSTKPRLPTGEIDSKMTEERRKGIDDALEWIKSELQDMRVQDQDLARQFLSLKQDIQQLKLTRSCEEHQVMLEEVQCELEELDDLPDVLDLPAYGLSDNPLRHLGVTRMNIHSRRFSTC